MKTKFSTWLLIIVALFTASTCSHAQTRDTTIADQYASATLDTNYIAKTKTGATDTTYKNRTVIIQNNNTASADTLIVWFNNDSTKLKFYLPPRGVWKGKLLLKSINTRIISGAATIYRPIYVSEGDIELTTNTISTVQSTADSAAWMNWDSTTITLPAAVVAFTDSDIVRTSTTAGGALIALTASRTNGGGGFIIGYKLESDTANIANAMFDIIALYDSVGVGVTLPANNALYKTNFTATNKYLPDITTVTLTRNGASSTGATAAWGYANNLNIPYRTTSGSRKLYFIIVARGAWTPNANGSLRLTAYFLPTN